MDALSSRSRDTLSGPDKMIQDLADEPKEKKMKITICGRSIWNHASQRSMGRDGWLHFSIMAKDYSFEDAMSLCRSWNEFFKLITLSLWQFFLASRWSGWGGFQWVEDLTQMGLVPERDG